MTYVATLTQKGQVTIPIDIRRHLKLKPYHKVVFDTVEKQVVIKPYKDFLSLKGTLRSKKKYSDKAVDKAINELNRKEYVQKTTHS